MKKIISYFFFAIALSLTTPSYGKVIEDCDIPGGFFKKFKTTNSEECKISCDNSSSCNAFTHISGWNQCFLKKKFTRKVNLKIHSGEIVTKDSKRTIKQMGARIDIPGKDLRKVPNVDSFTSCSKLCIDELKCVAYSYLDGYRDCWLKDRSGKQQNKIFSCGVKEKNLKKEINE